MLSNLSLWVIGNTIASISSSIYLSNPPISVYSSVGLSSISIALTLESYSGGNFSYTMKLSLLHAINSPGLSSSGSTIPITGKYIVCRPVVLITNAFFVLLTFSYLNPDVSLSSSSSSTSKISPTLATI